MKELLVAVAVLAFAAGDIEGQPATAGETLRVGLSREPPFAMRAGADADWQGLSVELWRRVADDLSLDFEWIVAEPEMLRGRLERGELDVVLTLTVSPELETALDFAPIHYTGRLGVAEPQADTLGAILRRVFSPRFLRISAGVAVFLFFVGVAIWLLERRGNEEQFQPNAGSGIWSGFWWAGVTMTTIGYGDKAPRTVAGRVLALFWMLAAIAITASLTASVTTSLSASEGGDLDFPSDLRNAKVGALSRSRAATYLIEQRIPHRTFPDVKEALSGLRNRRIDFLVSGNALLRHAVSQSGERSPLRVRAVPAGEERYAMAVREGSALLEPLSRSVLERLEDPSWPSLVKRYVPE